MKYIFMYLSIALLLAIAVLNTNCNTNNPDPEYPTYSYVDPVINPPDIFQVVYNISTVGDKVAYITFIEDAVWVIEKLGDSRINYWTYNGTESIEIVISDTLGLEAGHTYVFVANNNNYLEYTNLFTQFNKLAIDYESFEPKF